MPKLSPAVRYFLDLAAISSPSYKEKPVFDHIETLLKGKKCQVKRIPYTTKEGFHSENMIIRLSATDNSKKSLFFDAHADTVPPCDKVTPILDEAKGIIKSDGTSVLGSDDKAGIAAMLAALDWVLESGAPHGELLFIISSAEEVGLIGAGQIPQEELTGLHYGFVLDSSGPVGCITLQAPYHYDYHITVKGKASHAGMAPEKGLNAVVAAAGLILDLPNGRISEDTVSNVGIVKGGLARNVVPEVCEIIGEFRSLDDSKCAPLVAQVEAAVAKHRPHCTDIICDLKKTNEGYNFTPDSPITAFTVQALKDIGITARFERSTGGTNANIYVGKGVSSTVISIGMEEIHSVNEYIRIQDLEDTARMIIQMIQNS